MQVAVQLNKAQMRAVERMLSGIKRGVPAALSGAANDTAKKTVTDMSAAIRRRVSIKKKDIDPHLKRTRATPAHPSATITLSESVRLGLKYFGARQTKRGVTYKIDRAGGRKTATGAFGPRIPRLGGHVFRRATKKRTPLVKLHGVSPWGTFVKADMRRQTEAEAGIVLHVNVMRRVNFLLLKERGAI